jgi:predicted RNA-binding Zn-ribbon protein involved in translation (DUF1610 family)
MAVVIETPSETGVEWGVSLTSSNPEAIDYIACKDHADAQRIAERLRCPTCGAGSEKLLHPTKKCNQWTCDPCGADFIVPGAMA